ncbi:hypothetical protein NDU88_002009, partial [Pleurodeles waltl]
GGARAWASGPREPKMRLDREPFDGTQTKRAGAGRGRGCSTGCFLYQSGIRRGQWTLSVSAASIPLEAIPNSEVEEGPPEAIAPSTPLE